eukprot:11171409-Lingulodinium_polyedra.AAC.1
MLPRQRCCAERCLTAAGAAGNLTLRRRKRQRNNSRLGRRGRGGRGRRRRALALAYGLLHDQVQQAIAHEPLLLLPDE